MRERLTKRFAAIDNTEFSTDLGKDGQKEVDASKYDKTVSQVRDENTGWKEDKREENGLPAFDTAQAPKIAKIRQAVAKSVRVAVLLLGEKAPEDVIECQARDFMASMSEGALDRTLQRFAETEELYKKDEEKEEAKTAADAKDEAVVEEKVAAERDPETEQAEGSQVLDKEPVAAGPVADGAMAPAMINAKVAAVAQALLKLAEEIAKDEVKEVKEEKKVEEKTAAEEKKVPDFIQEKIDPKKEKTAAEDVKEETAEEKEDDVKMAAEEITFDGAENVGEQAPDPEIESALRGEDSVKAASEKKSEIRKAGVKSLGGQPRLASEGVVGDLSSLWEGAPDLKSLFHG